MIDIHIQNVLVRIKNISYQSNNNLEMTKENPIVTSYLLDYRLYETCNIFQMSSTEIPRY